MTYTQTQQPESLRLADVLEKMPGYDWNKTYCETVFQLRHIQHQNECLTAENEALKAERARSGLAHRMAVQRCVQAAVSEAVAAEREACEERVEALYEELETPYLVDIVRAIYARDET